MSTPRGVDLAGTREPWVQLDHVANAPNPTRLILVKNGTYTGVLQNGLSVKDTQLYQDTNPANTQGNGIYWETFGHNFITTGTKYLFDMTDNKVYDLNAYDTNTLIVVWP